VLDKDKRKTMKNWLKNHILLGLFGNLEGNSVQYDKTTGNWNISIQVGFDIPNGLDEAKNGINEDIKREGIQQFLTEQMERLNFKLGEYFGVSIEEAKEENFNLTYIFPPTFITIQDGEHYRLKTKEEMEAISLKAPSLFDMMKRDVQLIEEGYYEFIPGTSVEEYEIDAFRLKRYSQLRARYKFSLPHLRVESFIVEEVEPIFSKLSEEAEIQTEETVA